MEPWKLDMGQGSGCTCCSVGVGCCLCDATPNTWTFTLTGITRGTCEDIPNGCLGLNGTWILSRQSLEECVWNSGEFTGCGGASIHATLACSPSGSPPNTWVLNIPQIGTYQAAGGGTWNCLGVNVLDLVTSEGVCTVPGSITISPV